MATPDAQYVIDIAAGMREGEHTAKELDRLTEQLVHGGRQADHFDDALVALDARLRDAQGAASAAARDLAEHATQYAVLERAANRTARAVERAGPNATDKQIAAANKAKAALDGYSGRMHALERAAYDTAQAEAALVKQHRHVERMSKRVEDRLGDSSRKVLIFRGALGDVGGPLAEFGERLFYPVQAFVDLNEEFGSNAAALTVAGGLYARATTAILGMAAAAGVATAALTGLAIYQADARRETELHRDAMAALHPELAAVRSQYGAIADGAGILESRVEGLAAQLAEAGVSVSDMPKALRAAAMAESALGDGGARTFLEDLKAGRLEVNRFAADVESKFGGIVEQRLLGLDAQGARAKRVFGSLFAEVDAEPALRVLQRILDLFDENSATGQAMRAALGQIFNPLIEGTEKAERFLLGFLIGLTDNYLQLRDLFADSFLADLLPEMGDAADLGETLAAVLSAIGVVAGVAAAAILGIPYVIAKLIGRVQEGVEYLGDLRLVLLDMGLDLVDGLIEGITGRPRAIRDALMGMVSGGIDAVKSFLGIASPSKLMADTVGEPMGEGVAVGVEGQGDRIGRAMQSAVAPALATAAAGVGPLSIAGGGAAGGGAAGGGAAGGGTVYHLSFAGAVFNFNGVAGAESVPGSIADALALVLEGDARSVGAVAA